MGRFPVLTETKTAGAVVVDIESKRRDQQESEKTGDFVANECRYIRRTYYDYMILGAVRIETEIGHTQSAYVVVSVQLGGHIRQSCVFSVGGILQRTSVTFFVE